MMIDNNFKLFLVFIFFLFSTLFFSGEYIVGVENMDYYPYSEVIDGKYHGVGRDILDLFAKQYGHKFVYQDFPYIRNLRSFLNQEIDFQFPEDPAWLEDMKKEYSLKIVYSDPVVGYIDGVSVLAENKGRGIERLRFLGTIIGFTPVNEYMMRIRENKIILHENPVVAGLILQLLDTRIDGIYLSVDVVKHHLIKMEKPQLIVFDDKLPYRKGYYKLATI